jgi:hypothetical protein
MNDMNDMNDTELLDIIEAVNNDNNTSIIDLTSAKIKKYKNDILQQLQFKGARLKELHKKLKEYRYCTDLKDLQEGYFIRWIPLKNIENLKLTNGGIVCNVKLVNNVLQILCKNFNNMFFQIKFDEVVLFQKLSNQENIILGILDYIEN